MDRDQLDQLRNEQIYGNKASIAFETWIEPFIRDKKQQLFEAFIDINISNDEDLKEIKRMVGTLDLFSSEIMSYIDTGKMAARSLAEGNNQHEGTH